MKNETACYESALGTEEPKYYVSGSDIMVEFKALRSALIDQPKAPKHQSTKAPKRQSTDVGALEDSILLRMIEILRDEPDISQDALGKRLGLTRRNIQKNINFLKESGRIKRIGGKRYGHWQIND